MKTKHTIGKNNNIYTFMACIGLFFSCVFIINAFNTSKIYDGVIADNDIATDKVLGQKIAHIKNTLQANEEIKRQEYEKALDLISGNTAEDYYNRGTILTLLAYKNGLQSQISGMENAQIFLVQAQQNFSVAKKLGASEKIRNAIIKNEDTINTLSTTIDIKTCYSIGQNIITNITDILDTIKNIKGTLDEEEIYLNKKAKTLDAKCYAKLMDIIDTSRGQVSLLQSLMQKNNTKYKSDLSEKIQNPKICINTPYENILPSISKGKDGLEEYNQQHGNSLEAIKSNDKQRMDELCKQTKNDGQINQNIENSLQELLQKLENNTQEKQEQKRATNEVKYKDFFNENEKNALEEIQKTSQGRIDTILKIRSKGNYNPEQYINNMFNQFYGNSGDFINLHK